MDARQLRQKALRQAKQKVREKKSGRDYLIIQAVEAIDELDDISNLLIERVRNWYAAHYPELPKLVRSLDIYLEIIILLKHRKRMIHSELEKIMPPEQAKKVAMLAEQTMGADIDERDLDEIGKFAELALHSKRQRDELANYVEEATTEMMPNMHSLVGGLMCARLLAKANSFERLAELPSSTIQVLGAEKALFAHIKKGVKPPKHGLIFAYPPLMQAPKKLKGKVARALAGKLAIAARMDYFKHGFDPSLRDDLEKKVRGITKR